MYQHLQSDILTNSTNYFFCLLGPRFDLAAKLMAAELERRFGRPFEPIYIYSAMPNQLFAKDNFIVLNSQAEIIEQSSNDRVIHMPEFEDLNVDFVQSDFIRELGLNLQKKQERIFVYAFTSACLKIDLPGWLILGPYQHVAARYDNKIEQYMLFEKLNLLRNRARICNSLKAIEDSLALTLPCYISASYASGGSESGIVYNLDMLHKIFSGMRTPNKNDRFLVSEIFEKVKIAPNASAIVTGKNSTQVLIISDQILAGTRYLGNAYPSEVPDSMAQEIQRIMISIGNYLSLDGFRGLFGCDFLVNEDGRLAVIDLNPRRQGGYLCNLLALKSVGVDLISMELDCALSGRSEITLDYSQIQSPRAWAHSKVTPIGAGQRICGEIVDNTPEEVFESELPQSYAAAFYELGAVLLNGYVGYVMTAGRERKLVMQELRMQTERVLSEVVHNLSTGSESKAIFAKRSENSNKDFRGADLRGIDLRRIPLRGSNLLREANLAGSNLAGQDLSGADLRGANLTGANLEEANLQGANLEGALLKGASLFKAHIQRATLRNANLRGVNLESANLQEADLSQALLQEATLRYADLRGAILTEARLTQVDLEGAELAGACLKRADLAGVNLKNTSLTKVDGTEARFTGANLAASKFEGVLFTNADLSRTDLQWANLDKAILTGSNIEGARLSHASLVHANLQRAHLTGADLTSANLENANLEEAILQRTCLYQANLRNANLKNADLRNSLLSEADLIDTNLEEVNLAHRSS